MEKMNADILTNGIRMVIRYKYKHYDIIVNLTRLPSLNIKIPVNSTNLNLN